MGVRGACTAPYSLAAHLQQEFRYRDCRHKFTPVKLARATPLRPGTLVSVFASAAPLWSGAGFHTLVFDSSWI